MKIKLQSAMEYLMTYGWAILVIAIVLGALASLGILNPNSLLGTHCVATPGFSCQGTPAMTTSGEVNAEFVYAGTSPIYVVGAACSSASNASGYPAYPYPNGAGYAASNGYYHASINGASNEYIPIYPGQTFNITLYCYSGKASPSYSIGQVFTGTIWLNYTTPQSSGSYAVLPITSSFSVKAT